MKPSVDVFKAIARLRSNQDFLAFQKWVEEESHKATEAALSSTNPHLVFKEMGSAQTLRDLIAAIYAAKPTLS